MEKKLTFIQDAIRTKSDKFYNTELNTEDVYNYLSDAIDALTILDDVKKKLFYNKPSSVLLPAGSEPWNDEYTPEQIDIIHAILGIATEAGELLEALNKFLSDGEFDTVNLKEECGDLFWYQAILANATDNTFEGIQSTVIAKLKKRFPDKFTEEDANNRDLIAEREILENE